MFNRTFLVFCIALFCQSVFAQSTSPPKNAATASVRFMDKNFRLDHVVLRANVMSNGYSSDDESAEYSNESIWLELQPQHKTIPAAIAQLRETLQDKLWRHSSAETLWTFSDGSPKTLLYLMVNGGVDVNVIRFQKTDDGVKVYRYVKRYEANLTPFLPEIRTLMFKWAEALGELDLNVIRQAPVSAKTK